jgi:hypothetical protein
MRLHRFRQDPQILVVEVIAVMSQRTLGPGPAQHHHCLVEQLRSRGSLDAERLLLVRVGDAETERRQEAAARQPIERGQFLGEHDRVAARQHHHAHAELQPLGASCGERHADQRIRRVAADPLAQPQAVEAESFERVDHGCEALVVEPSAGAEGVADADVRFTHAGLLPR